VEEETSTQLGAATPLFPVNFNYTVVTPSRGRANRTRPARRTDIGGQLFGGASAQLGNEQDGVAVGLHGGPSDGAQPVVGRVVQLGKVIA